MGTKEKTPETTYGVNVSVPNLSKAKFEAIKAIAQSNLELAKALNSVNTKNLISNNIISNAETGIRIEGPGTDSDINDWNDSL